MFVTRRRELWLLLLVYTVLGLGYFVVWQAYLPTWRTLFHGQEWKIFLAPVGSLLAWVLVSVTLSLRRCRETLLVPVVAFLTGFGLLMLLRLAGGAYPMAIANPRLSLPDFADYQKQLLSFALGWLVLMGMLIFWKDYRTLARYKYLVASATVVLLLLTTFFGHVIGGQTLSLSLGHFTFQPHDPVKILLVIFMAAYLVEKQELISFAAGRYGWLSRRDFRYMGPLVALWLMVMAFIFRDGDLGASLLLFGAFLGMLYLGTERKIYVAIGLALFILGGAVIFRLAGGTQSSSQGHARNRIQTRIAVWLNPWEGRDPDGTPTAEGKGYQITQSLIAVGNGRGVGAGLGGGYPERIPAVHTDLIYAAIAEDFGLAGSIVVLGIFLLAIGRTFSVALRTDDRFGKLLASGLGTTLALQTWVIIAGVLKLIPLTGITLPFISYGGTSLVVNLALVGLVLKIAESPRSEAVPIPGNASS